MIFHIFPHLDSGNIWDAASPHAAYLSDNRIVPVMKEAVQWDRMGGGTRRLKVDEKKKKKHWRKARSLLSISQNTLKRTVAAPRARLTQSARANEKYLYWISQRRLPRNYNLAPQKQSSNKLGQLLLFLKLVEKVLCGKKKKIYLKINCAAKPILIPSPVQDVWGN